MQFCILYRLIYKMAYILYVKPTYSTRSIYEATAAAYNARPYAERDAGFDLFSGAISASGTTRIPQQIVAAFYDGSRGLFRAYWLLPRSSISKTPLRLANSVGLIDAGYRGPIMAACDGNYNVAENERLFQLASPDLLPWDEVRIVSEIPGGPTVRGEGGFGSTG
jgi:dUTP pyrophosphatase